MAYESKNFSVMAYANGFTLWSYSTPDALSVVKESGYFNEIAPFARKGDMILAVANSAAEIETGILAVISVDGASAVVADFVKGSETASANS